MRIQFTFATPLKALKTAEVALFLVRKICEKRKKEEDGDFSYISDVGAVTAHDACCHCIHSSCCRQQALSALTTAANTFPLILSDIPRLFSFLKRDCLSPAFTYAIRDFKEEKRRGHRGCHITYPANNS